MHGRLRRYQFHPMAMSLDRRCHAQLTAVIALAIVPVPVPVAAAATHFLRAAAVAAGHSLDAAIAGMQCASSATKLLPAGLASSRKCRGRRGR